MLGTLIELGCAKKAMCSQIASADDPATRKSHERDQMWVVKIIGGFECAHDDFFSVNGRIASADDLASALQLCQEWEDAANC